jgi:hypothetical protein
MDFLLIVIKSEIDLLSRITPNRFFSAVTSVLTVLNCVPSEVISLNFTMISSRVVLTSSGLICFLPKNLTTPSSI